MWFRGRYGSLYLHKEKKIDRDDFLFHDVKLIGCITDVKDNEIYDDHGDVDAISWDSKM